MFEKVEVFYGALRFSPFWIAVDLLLILHFFLSWRSSWKKTGWKIDFWWYTLFLQFFIFILMMYPFNASIYNALALHAENERVDEWVDKAFSVGVLGYLCLWAGRYLYDRPKKKLLFPPLATVFKRMEAIIEQNVSSKFSCYLLIFATVSLFAVIAPFFFSAGFAFSARDYFLEKGALRPLFNLALCFFSLTIWYLGIHYEHFRKKRMLVLLLSIFLLSIFLGSRWLIISNILFVVAYRIFANQGKIALWKIAALLPALLCGAIFLAGMREGAGGPLNLFGKFLLEVLYGSHFSDNRDFAWMLSYWDGEFLYGKTYLAALLSFLPRFASAFREIWSYGTYSAALVEFDAAHAGLRSGPFGEAYFNFGMPGVILLGTLGGYALRMADVKLKQAIALHGDVIRGFAATFVYFLVSSFFNTSGFWFLYFFIFINLGLYLINSVSKKGWIYAKNR